MKSEISALNTPAEASHEPLWVTSQYSPKQLEGKLARIEWTRAGGVVDWGVYRLEVGTYGHSKRIQEVRAVLLEGLGDGLSEFEFDQADADLLHRSNESPKRYAFVAKLDRERPRRQNPQLERLVRERRSRKAKDEKGEDHWEPFVDPVLKPAPEVMEKLPLPKKLEEDEEVF